MITMRRQNDFLHSGVKSYKRVSRASFKSLASGVRKHSYIVLVLGISLHSVAVYLESKSSTFTKFKSSKVLSL